MAQKCENYLKKGVEAGSKKRKIVKRGERITDLVPIKF